MVSLLGNLVGLPELPMMKAIPNVDLLNFFPGGAHNDRHAYPSGGSVIPAYCSSFTVRRAVVSALQWMGNLAGFFTVSRLGIVSMIQHVSCPSDQEVCGAIRLFGAILSPAVAETGPRELRDVVSAFNAMRAQIQNSWPTEPSMLARARIDLLAVDENTPSR